MPTTSCLSCQIANGDISAEGGDVTRTSHFNVSQDFEYMIPGFMIVASNRHFKGLDEMTADESQDFISLVQRVRAAQRTIGIGEVYYFYNEDTRHHFHLWMIPRTEWMSRFGRSLECVAPSLQWARENLRSETDSVRKTAAKLRAALA